MAYYLAGDWLHNTDPTMPAYYVGNDARIYDANGNGTGYELVTQRFIVGPMGNFLVDQYGNVDLPFADTPANPIIGVRRRR